MGLSLRNIGKKIVGAAEGVERQVNPFDHGATAANPHPAPAPPKPVVAPPKPMFQTTPIGKRPNPFGTPTPAPNPLANPFTATTPAKPETGANKATASFLRPISAAIKGTASAVGKIATVPINADKALVAAATHNKQAEVNAAKAAKEGGKTAVSFAQFIPRAATQVGLSAWQGVHAGKFNPAVGNLTPHTGVEKFLLGSQPVQSFSNVGNETIKKSGKAAGYSTVGIQAITDALALKGGVESVSKGAPAIVNAIKERSGSFDEPNGLPAPEEAPQEVKPPEPPKVSLKGVAKGAVKLAVAALEKTKDKDNTLEGTIAAPAIPKADTGFPVVDDAIDKVAANYSKSAQHEGGVQDVLGQANGAVRVGQRVAGGLQKALSSTLTKEENVAVDTYLDSGVVTKDLSPEAFRVANGLKPIYDQAHNIRSSIDPNIGKVDTYSSRIPATGLKAAVQSGTQGIMGKINDIADLRNLDSTFSKQRSLDKFISKDETVVGSPKDLRLKDQGNGKFTDDSGKVFLRNHATKQELMDAGAGNYELKASTNNGIYHGDTASLKARAEAVQALSKDPNSFGLYTKDQVDTGAVPEGVREVNASTLKDANGDPLYASPKDAKQLERQFAPTNKATPVPLRVYDAATNAATQAIVLNPFFHGMNQLYQTAIAAGNLPGFGTGWIKVAQGVLSANEDDMQAVLEAGGGGSDFGATTDNLMSKITGGATKVNTKAMAAIELRLRAGLYKASLDDGMSSSAAVDNINRFLGDTKAMDETARRAGLFLHYFKTMAGAAKEQIAHPVENIGANVNTAALAAMTAAVSYGYKKATGNPNAYVRVPGELGLVKEAVQSVNEARKGQLPGIVTNHVNPILKEGIEQATDKDLFTNQPVSSSPSTKIGPVTLNGRLTHAISSTIAPTQTAGKVIAGKRSIAETAANQLGLNTPHAKGYEAAPKASILNTKGAVASKTGDPTGYDQQQNYFDSLTKLKKTVASSDTATRDDLNKYIDRSKDPTTGQTIQNSPAASLQNATALATNDRLRGNIQKFEKAHPSHDPMWDLPADKLATLMTYKAQLEGSAERSTLLAKAQNGKDNWIQDVQTAQQKFYDNLPKIPGAKVSKVNSATPTYPKFDDSTTKLLATYNNASADQKATLMDSYSGELSNAFNQIAQWTNKQRVAQTGKDTPQMRSFPQADAATQAIIKAYNAVPKGGGSKGGNKYRSDWIAAHPDDYKKMQNYLTQASLNSLITNASKAQFAGTEPDQQLLKDIKNVGQYDIATTKNSDGTSTYSVNPSAAYAQTASTSTFTPYSSSSKTSSYKDARYLSNEAKDVIHAPSGKIKKLKVSIKKSGGSGGSKKYKVKSLAPTKNAKVKLKV